MNDIDIWFGTGDHTILSNLGNKPHFDKAGRSYYSVEHGYQSNKSGKFDIVTYNKYYSYGCKIPGILPTKAENNWNIILMERIMDAAFTQNKNAIEYLIGTYPNKITHVKERSIWKTEFPRILTELREQYIYIYGETK